MRFLFVLFFLTFPAWAQDDDACDIDLSPIAAQLIQAQAQASQGDASAALTTIADIQAQLDAITAACQGLPPSESTAEPRPATPTATPEPITQASQTVLLSGYQFDLPADWLLIDNAGITLAGPTDGAARAIIRPNGLLREGEQATALVIGNAQAIVPELSGATSAQQIVTLYRQTFEQDFAFTIQSDIAQVTIASRETWRFSFNAPGYSGFVSALSLDDNTFMLVIAAAAVGDFDTAEGILNTVIETLEAMGS